MSTTTLRQANTNRSTSVPEEKPSTRRPRFNPEILLIVLSLLAILAWGFIGVDRSVLDELSDTMTASERRALEARSSLPPIPFSRGDDAEGGAVSGDGSSPQLVAQGAAVFEANGCYACHSIDGSEKIGPSLLGLWGTEQAMVDGSTAVMDDAYLRESILQPQARIVEGYVDAAMPSYEGLVTDEDLDALSAYLRSLR